MAREHNQTEPNRDGQAAMDPDMDSCPAVSERGDADVGLRTACSSNGSGGEDDDAEAESEAHGREAGDGHGCHHAPERTALLGGREQEVSVEIGETYLCQRADKTWRKLLAC